MHFTLGRLSYREQWLLSSGTRACFYRRRALGASRRGVWLYWAVRGRREASPSTDYLSRSQRACESVRACSCMPYLLPAGAGSESRGSTGVFGGAVCVRVCVCVCVRVCACVCVCVRVCVCVCAVYDFIQLSIRLCKSVSCPIKDRQSVDNLCLLLSTLPPSSPSLSLPPPPSPSLPLPLSVSCGSVFVIFSSCLGNLNLTTITTHTLLLLPPHSLGSSGQDTLVKRVCVRACESERVSECVSE